MEKWKSGKKGTVNVSFTVVESCMQTGFEHSDGLYSYGILVNKSRFLVNKKD